MADSALPESVAIQSYSHRDRPNGESKLWVNLSPDPLPHQLAANLTLAQAHVWQVDGGEGACKVALSNCSPPIEGLLTRGASGAQGGR